MKSVVVIALGSAIGGICRYSAQFYFAKMCPLNFPVGTFLVNIVGCFCIGIFYALSEKLNLITPEWRLFLVTGFCGGFTTFSAFAFENLNLLQTGNYINFGLYTAGSIIFGIVAVFFGMQLIKLI